MSDTNNNIKPVNVIFYYNINNINYEYNLTNKITDGDFQLYKKLKNKKIYDNHDSNFIDKSGTIYFKETENYIYHNGNSILERFIYKELQNKDNTKNIFLTTKMSNNEINNLNILGINKSIEVDLNDFNSDFRYKGNLTEQQFKSNINQYLLLSTDISNIDYKDNKNDYKNHYDNDKSNILKNMEKTSKYTYTIESIIELLKKLQKTNEHFQQENLDKIKSEIQYKILNKFYMENKTFFDTLKNHNIDYSIYEKDIENFFYLNEEEKGGEHINNFLNKLKTNLNENIEYENKYLNTPQNIQITSEKPDNLNNLNYLVQIINDNIQYFVNQSELNTIKKQLKNKKNNEDILSFVKNKNLLSKIITYHNIHYIINEIYSSNCEDVILEDNLYDFDIIQNKITDIQNNRMVKIKRIEKTIQPFEKIQIFDNDKINVFFNVIFEDIQDYSEIKFNLNLIYEDEIMKSKEEVIYKDFELQIYDFNTNDTNNTNNTNDTNDKITKTTLLNDIQNNKIYFDLNLDIKNMLSDFDIIKSNILINKINDIKELFINPRYFHYLKHNYNNNIDSRDFTIDINNLSRETSKISNYNQEDNKILDYIKNYYIEEIFFKENTHLIFKNNEKKFNEIITVKYQYDKDNNKLKSHIKKTNKDNRFNSNIYILYLDIVLREKKSKNEVISLKDRILLSNKCIDKASKLDEILIQILGKHVYPHTFKDFIKSSKILESKESKNIEKSNIKGGKKNKYKYNKTYKKYNIKKHYTKKNIYSKNNKKYKKKYAIKKKKIYKKNSKKYSLKKY